MKCPACGTPFHAGGVPEGAYGVCTAKGCGEWLRKGANGDFRRLTAEDLVDPALTPDMRASMRRKTEAYRGTRAPDATPVCWECGAEVTARVIHGETRALIDYRPEPGAFFICPHCGAGLRMCDDFHLHPVTSEDLAELKVRAPQLFDTFETVRKAIRERRPTT